MQNDKNLRQSYLGNDERIHIMLDHAPICCFFFDQDEQILDCNQYALDLFEADSKEDVVGLLITKLAPKYQLNGELSTKFAKRMVDLTLKEGMGKTEWIAKSLAGKEFIVEATGIRVSYRDEQCVLVYMRDLPEEYEHISRQTEIRDAYRRLQAIFDGIPLACHFRDKNGNILECNQACPDFFGLSNKQEYIDRFFELSPEYQPCGMLSKEKAGLKTLEAFEKGWAKTDWTHKNKNGEEIPVEVTVVRVRWQKDDHVLAVMRDMREHHKLMEAERTLTRRLQLMLDSSPLACVIHDADLNILEVNRVVADLFELQDKQEYVDNFYDFSPEYQPDGRLSREKASELVKTANEMGSMTFGWMHQTRDGQPIPCEIVLEVVEHEGNRLMISYLRDLREINQALSMVNYLERLAYTDPLTGAYNRRYFMDKAEAALRSAIERERPFSLVLIDIDFFKAVNDNYGHDIGDEVLKMMAARLQNASGGMLVARFGGEEFIVLLPDKDEQAAADFARGLREAVTASKFTVSDELEMAVTASFGVGCKTEGCTKISGILKNADIALYKAKTSGRDTVVVYDEGLHGV